MIAIARIIETSTVLSYAIIFQQALAVRVSCKLRELSFKVENWNLDLSLILRREFPEKEEQMNLN